MVVDVGKPELANNIWIAAHTMESGAELLSFDCHFENIDGLVWTRPWQSPAHINSRAVRKSGKLRITDLCLCGLRG